MASSKKVGVKPSLPFGSSSGTSHAYSDYQHVKEQATISFIRLLAANKEFVQEKTQQEIEAEQERKKKDSKNGHKSETLTGILLVEGYEDAPACEVSECKKIIKLILDYQRSNAAERIQLLTKIDSMTEDFEIINNQLLELELAYDGLSSEENELDHQKALLKEKLSKLELKKADLALEKDSFTGKLMVAESERQNSVKDIRAAKKALSDALWRGKRSSDNDSTNGTLVSNMTISRASKKRISDDDSVSITNYDLLAGEYVVDSSELSLNVPAMPYYVIAKKRLDDEYSTISNSKGYKNTNSNRSSNTSVISGITASPSILRNSYSSPASLAGSSLMSPNRLSPMNSSSKTIVSKRLTNTSTQMTIARSKEIAKRVRSRSPTLDLPGSDLSYKGYTPSGLPRADREKVIDRLIEINNRGRSTKIRENNNKNVYINNSRDRSQSPNDNASVDSANLSFISSIGNASVVSNSNFQNDSIYDKPNTTPAVYYNERARTRHGRNTAIGRVRTSGRQSNVTIEDGIDNLLNKALTFHI